MYKISHNALPTLAAGLLLTVFSLQSQAAVIFNNYSYTTIAGSADDGVALVSYTSTTDLIGFPSVAEDYQSASTVDPIGGLITSYTDSYAYADVSSVYNFAGETFLYGFVDAGSTASVDSITNQVAYSYADAVIDIDFVIDTDYFYNFGSEWMEASGNANLYFDLYNWDTSTTVFSGNLIDAGDSPWFSGQITAGRYNLVVDAITDADSQAGIGGMDSGYASGGFGFGLSAVPVPGAVWLFASGLLGLIGFAKRKRS